MDNQLVSTEPIVDDDDAIAEALSQLSVSALTASVVQITGDPSFVRGPIRPRQFVQNEFQGMLGEEEQAQLRRDALKAICAWRDAGCPPPPQLSPEVIREVMDWIACEPVPEDSAALYAEEMDLAGQDPRAIRLPANAELPEDFSVLIIGLGASGLLAGIRLQEAGIPFEIIEKNAGVGGAWFENSYPGCRVDVASHFYSYSFERNNEFSEYYTRQPELQAYFRKTMEEHRIGDHVQWSREVLRAVWDDDAAQWTVTTQGPDGTLETRTASALISGVGVLNRPLIPDIAGLDRFGGPVFHSAQWDH